MSRVQIAVALSLVCASLAFAGPKDDFSSPKAAATSFFNALKDADEPAARNASVGSKEQQDLLGATVQMVAATRKLGEAAKAKFGQDEAAQTFGPENLNPSESFDKEIARLADAEVKIDGDKATLTPKEAASAPASMPAEKPLKLQKVDGKWKIDLAANEMGGGPDQPPTDQQIQMVKSMAQSVDQTAQEVSAGQYKTAADARQAMMAHLMMQLQAAQAAAASRPASGPTSAPASAPAK